MDAPLKKLIFAVLLLLISCSALSANSMERPKIGLVLSGGGALGFAHIGTLKMLDSLQIPIDYIAGTSMGGILGALYAIGYDGLELEKLVQQTDWIDLFTDHPSRGKLPYFEKKMADRFQLVFSMEGFHPSPPSGLIFGQKVTLLFSSLTFPYEHIHSFDRLPIPCRCVAVDLVTGNEVVLDRGSLARAMRSTMAIPTIFSPVEWGDSLLVDGGIMNNLPVDVVRAMGADIVIAVDVGNRLHPKEQINSALKVLDQSINMLGIQKWRENSKQADVLIRPDLEGLTMGDFVEDKIAQIIHDGKTAARQAQTGLVVLKYALNLGDIRNPLKLTQYKKPPKIFGLQITGHTTIPFSELYEMLGIRPGDPCRPHKIHERLVELKATGEFVSTGFDVIPVSHEHVRLLIRVREQKRPRIHGITIDGNERMGFQFLYQCLGIRPGDVLDTEALNRQIMKVYGLGYFETIRYDIESMGEDRVFLRIHVKELPYRKLRLGLWFDTFHKMVASVAFQRNDLLINGLRFDAELQMAGLLQFTGKLFYPSQTLNLPVYPFAYTRYRNAPVAIYDGYGHQIASYKDKSATIGAGLGLLLRNAFHADVALIQEHMFIEPDIALSDQTLFPTWEDRLREVRLTAEFDNLDSRLIPSNGLYAHFQYEGSFDELNTDVPYQWIHFYADLFHTFQSKHTVRLLNYWRESTSRLPVYKHYYNDDPEHLIGPDYHQVAMNDVSFVRLEYRYRLAQSLYMRLIANTTYRLGFQLDDPSYDLSQIWGFGIGIKVMSLLGPIDIVLSRGSKSAYREDQAQTNLFFSFGYRFF